MFSVKTVLCSQNFIKSLHFCNKMNFSLNTGIKTIEFKTCGKLYEELKKNNSLYKNSPSDGLPVKVEYADSFADKPSISSDVKTIVAIHGNPGNHKHLSGLVDHFKANESNVRVIVPNMPDFGLTRKTMAFWQSNEERTQFIRDFLKAINVSTIDCLISHSAGIHPISLIWTEPRELTVNSICLLNPQFLDQKYFTFCKRFSIFCRNRIGIGFADIIKPHILLRKGSPMHYESVDELLFFLLVHSELKSAELNERLDFLKTVKIPTLFVFGEKDKLFKKESYERMADKLGADHKDFMILSEDRKIEKESQRDNWIKVMSLKGGGHFSFAKYIQEVCEQMSKHCLKIDI